MDIVLFGIQGSGKGTLGKMIAEKYGFEIFETGSQLRKLSKENSDLGNKVKSIIEAGHLVPNKVVMDIIENFMARLIQNNQTQNALFDGVPRSIAQAATFDIMMKKLQRDFMGILIETPKKVVLKRLAKRRVCKKCKTVYPAFYKKKKCEFCHGNLETRIDDNPQSIKTRIDAYYKETTPVIERYKKSRKLIVMNGDQSIEAAGQDILKIVKEILKQA